MFEIEDHYLASEEEDQEEPEEEEEEEEEPEEEEELIHERKNLRSQLRKRTYTSIYICITRTMSLRYTW